MDLLISTGVSFVFGFNVFFSCEFIMYCILVLLLWV